MSYLLGQRDTLRLEVRDEQGNLSNADVALTLTKPDGTTASPAVDNPLFGVYTAQVTYDQAGDWLRVWQVSGAVVAVDSDQVHITAPALRIVGLAQVKKQLNIDPADTSQDEELSGYIDAVTEVVEDIVGPVLPRTVTETHTGGAGTLILRRPPVISVTAVVENGTTLADGAWQVDPETGILTRSGARWAGTVAVTYRAGRTVTPPSIRLAAKELAQVNFRPQLGGDYSPFDTDSAEEGVPGEVRLGFFVPRRVRELLKPYEQGGWLP
ncbi:phage gp6-like head-tail connector protein [Micromonospora sp. BRA006-A]|uniref:head-tail connector protein n=1 Tax=Micromonospora sp. BRA006-A TaxID=2962860 RepID=UPI00296E6D23|nr:head-tail connector protein [Micromonospora sp. BRA006-A]MDW3849659.1 phage gp6-like head-tail connector protein [Micromonospora sp. BRA006-A]